MIITQVDERDAQVEMIANGFRVFLIGVGGSIEAFNIDNCTASEAESWARELSTDGVFAIAARFDQSGGGVTLMWLIPPPQ